MPNLKVGDTSMDSAEQSLIDRIWTAIEAKDWETARSLLEDGISVMPDSFYLLQLYADMLIDELQDMEAGCLILRKFVRLAIEKVSKTGFLERCINSLTHRMTTHDFHLVNAYRWARRSPSTS
ncbi:hypothetical protein ACOJBO_12275 [Rhizobium beringeri]